MFTNQIITLVTALFVTMAAQANTKTIDAIEISGLGNYRGQYISLYYGVGSRASLSVSPSYFDISRTVVKRTLLITSDKVLSEATTLSLVSFNPRRPNIIGIVIHPQPEVTYLNADGSIPENEVANHPTRVSRLDSLLFKELEGLIAAQTVNGIKPAVVKYQLR